jgi:hypothetical protein
MDNKTNGTGGEAIGKGFELWLMVQNIVKDR